MEIIKEVKKYLKKVNIKAKIIDNITLSINNKKIKVWNGSGMGVNSGGLSIDSYGGIGYYNEGCFYTTMSYFVQNYRKVLKNENL